jgi:hypothetical protein
MQLEPERADFLERGRFGEARDFWLRRRRRRRIG